MHGKSHEQLDVRLPRFVYQPVTLLVTAAAARSVSLDFGRVKHTQHTHTVTMREKKNWRQNEDRQSDERRQGEENDEKIEDFLGHRPT